MGDDVTSIEQQIKHFKWCWDKTIKNFNKENKVDINYKEKINNENIWSNEINVNVKCQNCFNIKENSDEEDNLNDKKQNEKQLFFFMFFLLLA
jgi:hypothetical protein